MDEGPSYSSTCLRPSNPYPFRLAVCTHTVSALISIFCLIDSLIAFGSGHVSCGLVWSHLALPRAAMGLVSDSLYFALHPNQLRKIVQWWVSTRIQNSCTHCMVGEAC